ncbi:hypothetical protein GRI58_15135 [Porphyrobacter algicida]|uniref:Uncharacterized protein n=1 Tax=Qipengyuania algicida TaxID=1836209 RepID=A0A845AHM5_9SPHN|nr:hypothetical protein [Qipengyuania algicida]MXP30142.1 hypothetical protein [Qipengyuania algicida]
MTYLNKYTDERYVLAENACQNLARLAGLKRITDVLLLPDRLREGYRSPIGDLILQPAIDLQQRRFLRAVEETRIDLLLVETGLPRGQAPRFYITVLLPRRGTISQHLGMRLWLGGSGEPHLIPEPENDPAATQSFAVGQWLSEVGTPWADDADRHAGIERANALLLANAWSAPPSGAADPMKEKEARRVG